MPPEVIDSLWSMMPLAIGCIIVGVILELRNKNSLSRQYPALLPTMLGGLVVMALIAFSIS